MIDDHRYKLTFSPKEMKILEAAKELFLRYGVKKTTIDDIANQAGIAKGSVYLVFTSKEELFTRLAEWMCYLALERGIDALKSKKDLITRLVGFLDISMGEFHRLVYSTPHAADLIASKKSIAAETFEQFYEKIKLCIADATGQEPDSKDNPSDMIFAATFGVLRIVESDQALFRKKLEKMIVVILNGVGISSPRAHSKK